MQHAEVLDAIRQLTRNTFADLGANSPIEVSENILIRGETYCGRRFQCGELEAIWFVEEDEIKIYGGNGALVCVMSSDDALRQSHFVHSRAA
ncbi:MAG: hypothetical protein H8E44_04555 [Planctomycetes bacterium]|nr:hypothetical protein [Planctomycetota bacterium]MBL7044357.1 hypothetical protein [Pirellulaceae bacterium]